MKPTQREKDAIWHEFQKLPSRKKELIFPFFFGFITREMDQTVFKAIQASIQHAQR